MSDVCTRFAPSPTGHLHLGGARTALFNYLYARRHGGKFILRIEDTDRARSTAESVEEILDGLRWLGLEHDEGPFYQSQRSELYRRRVDSLVENGGAYYCFCSPEELEAQRKRAQEEGRRAVYERTCRDLGRTPRIGETPVVRLASPLEGETVVADLVRGPVAFDNRELDDLILVRSDGTPTFHLVVVVDDIEMGVTHILRGEDHLTNTPRQIQIFRGLGAEPPRYGHLPLIVGSDRARLAKRHGATSVDAYRALGFLPSAVVNYLARLGWSHGDQEIFSREELVRLFDVGAVGRAAAAFDMEKFLWVNAQHMRSMADEALADALVGYAGEAGGCSREDLVRAMPLLKDRARTLAELAEGARFLTAEQVRYDAKAARKFLGSDDTGRLRELAAELEAIDAWTAESIEAAFRALVERLDVKLGKLAQPARVALTGGTASPGIFEVCEVLGKQRTIDRLRSACDAADAGSLALAEQDDAPGGA